MRPRADYDYDSGPEMDIHAEGQVGAADPYAGTSPVSLTRPNLKRCTNHRPRCIFFKGQTRGSHRSRGRPRDHRLSRTRWTSEINDPIPMDEGVPRRRRTGFPLFSVQ